MRHPDDGSLRRLLDEAWAVPLALRKHVAQCKECRRRCEAIAEDARFASEAFGSLPEAIALASARHRTAVLATGAGRPRARVPHVAGGWRWAIGVAAASSLLIGIAGGPIGSYAKDLLLVFQPKSIEAIPLSAQDVGKMAGLQAFGAVRGSGAMRLLPATGAADAQSIAGFAAPQPGYVPAGLGQPAYAALRSHTETFRLDQGKLEAYARRLHRPLPPLPANLAGTTLTLDAGPAVLLSYGGVVAGAAGSEPPRLLIAQMRSPKVYSTGATQAELENYLLSLPGISPGLQAQIRSIGSPMSTLPIPIPTDLASSSGVRVQGTAAILITERSGALRAVVWQKEGYLFAVAGSLPQSEILRMAEGLH